MDSFGNQDDNESYLNIVREDDQVAIVERRYGDVLVLEIQREQFLGSTASSGLPDPGNGSYGLIQDYDEYIYMQDEELPMRLGNYPRDDAPLQQPAPLSSNNRTHPIGGATAAPPPLPPSPELTPLPPPPRTSSFYNYFARVAGVASAAPE